MSEQHRSDAILQRLLTLHPKVIDLSLGRLQRLLALLDHPERRLPAVIHVAGTNGKGSVCAYLRAGLEAAGRRVHVYSSPHLARFHERIRLAGTLIDEVLLSDLLEECERANGGAPITFFEITTAAALLAFSRVPADYVILEVGLGGRLDATNVIDAPALGVITPVSIDHTQYLGETLAEIAAEKAGILKAGMRCVVAPQSDIALRVIEHAALRVGAQLLIGGQDWHVSTEAEALVYQDGEGLLDLPLPALPGAHQIDNAGTAIAALRALGLEGAPLHAACERAEWPARLQRLRSGPLVTMAQGRAEIWLDGGHNAAAGRAIAGHLSSLSERQDAPLHLIAGMLNTKDAAGFFTPFQGLASAVHTVAIPGESNSLTAAELAEQVTAAGMPVAAAPSLEAALAAVLDQTEGPIRVLVTGSLYLAGHILRSHA
ncbi:MAG: bifunctional folylpolyglutamate synthase/dihydrofolate synthase [Neomegalonema sp.]|nr:bifunctional folylpolyglutamate synthase/dihydrofolate synthase [Neomegalonema sp.]